ncbi:MAG: protein jag [Myxococcota bacterium]
MPDDGPSEVMMSVAEGVELSEIGEDAHEVFKDVMGGMGFGVTVTVTESEDVVRFDIEGGAYGDALAAKELHLVDAIQHLVDKTVNFDSDDRKKILIDVDGAKQKADEDLGDSAREVAKRVLDEGETIKMGPMDARSRRLVHIALRDMEGVVTRSEGEGAYRRVCVEAKS